MPSRPRSFFAPVFVLLLALVIAAPAALADDAVPAPTDPNAVPSTQPVDPAATTGAAPGATGATPAATGATHGCAWVVPWDRTAWNDIVAYDNDVVGVVSPFVLEVAANGVPRSVRGAVDRTLDATVTGAGVTSLATISNHFDGVRVHRAIGTLAHRRNHVARVLALAESGGWNGVDLDYENLQPRDRAAYSDFVARLATALHANGLRLSVTVQARTFLHAGSTQALDYAALGAAADDVRVMAYDEHWSGGAAGPVASAVWVAQVAAYTASLVPPAKLWLGVPFYGYHWRSDQRHATAVSADQALRVAAAAKAKVQWSDLHGEAHASWKVSRVVGHGKGRHKVTTKHEMWWSTSASSVQRARIASDLGLAGICAWHAGTEDAATWPALRSFWTGVPAPTTPAAPAPGVATPVVTDPATTPATTDPAAVPTA